MKRSLSLLLAATCFLAVVTPRVLAQEDQETPQVDESREPAMPAQPQAIAHPPAERPPLPEPAAHIVLPPVAAKPVQGASWRSTAQLLAAGRKLEKPCSSIVVEAGYGQSLIAVLAAVPRAGLKITALNSDAGEILAVKPDSPTIKIVITITEFSPAKTRIAAGCHRCSGETAKNVIASLIQLCTQSIPKQERI